MKFSAKRKAKEWDGKYYRYCKVTMDESHNGLWYRNDDITLITAEEGLKV